MPRTALIVAATVIASFVACNTLSGVDEIGICGVGECIDAAGPTKPDGAANVRSDGGSAATDGGNPSDGDAKQVCGDCDGGTCCAPNICRTNGTCAACGASSGLGNQSNKCGADGDCCNAQKCNAAGACVTSCGGAGAQCAFAPGVGGGQCCMGFRCELMLIAGQCVACKAEGATCSDEQPCCAGRCENGVCKGNDG